MTATAAQTKLRLVEISAEAGQLGSISDAPMLLLALAQACEDKKDPIAQNGPEKRWTWLEQKWIQRRVDMSMRVQSMIARKEEQNQGGQGG